MLERETLTLLVEKLAAPLLNSINEALCGGDALEDTQTRLRFCLSL
jgi:hypothetical protein